MLARSARQFIAKGSLCRNGPSEASAAALRRSMATTITATTFSIFITAVTPTATLCTGKYFEHTAPQAAAATGAAPCNNLSTQLSDLMDSYAEAQELIRDAMESVGTTYFAEDVEDAESQAKDVLKRWADVQILLESSGQTEELQKLRSMHDLKIKQMKAVLETVREAGGSG